MIKNDAWQLISEPNNNYCFDSNYNLLSDNGKTAASNALDEMIHLGEIKCSYDLRGNLIAKETPSGTHSYSYDALNRLKEDIATRLILKIV